MRTITLMICLVTGVLAQPVEHGWRGIQPLVSTKSEVEEKLGKPEEIDKNGYHRFRLKEAYVTVNYSTAPCRPNQYNRGEFNVAEGTVLRYWVSFNDPFESPIVLAFDKRSYVKDVGHTNSILYYNGTSGVIISAEEMQGREYFIGLEFQPPTEKKEKLVCVGSGYTQDQHFFRDHGLSKLSPTLRATLRQDLLLSYYR